MKSSGSGAVETPGKELILGIPFGICTPKFAKSTVTAEVCPGKPMLELQGTSQGPIPDARATLKSRHPLPRMLLCPGASAAQGRAGGDAPIDVGRLGLPLSKASSQPWLQISALLCSLQQVKLEEFGRPKIDGELKVRSIVNHTKQDR